MQKYIIVSMLLLVTQPLMSMSKWQVPAKIALAGLAGGTLTAVANKNELNAKTSIPKFVDFDEYTISPKKRREDAYLKVMKATAASTGAAMFFFLLKHCPK